MKQPFQFKRDEFSRLTRKLVGISHPSFLNKHSIEETLMNCLIAIGGENSAKIEEIVFMEYEKVHSNGMSPSVDILFTLVKLENAENADFLKIIAQFNA